MLSSYPTCCITNDKDIGLLNAVIAFFVTFNYLVFIVYVNVFLHMFLVQIWQAPNAIEFKYVFLNDVTSIYIPMTGQRF